MSNLSITMRCNNNCPYCFAQDSQSDDQAGNMSRETFQAALKYLKRSDIDQVRLLGGEPTLHDDFLWMLEEAQKQDLRILVFSNGMMSEEVLEKLSDLDPERFRLLLNTIDPVEGNTGRVTRQQLTMERLGKRCMVGVNIYRRGQDLEFLAEYVEQYDLIPEIRLGIAHPVLSKQNVYLHSKFYAAIGLKIVDLFYKTKEKGISLGLDCGFVPCMFPQEVFKDIGQLLEKAGQCCKPNIDLLPDGNFISCYPLNDLKKIVLTSTTTADELRESFARELEPFQKIGIFPYCSKCELFGTRCDGGCQAQKMNRLDY